MKKQAILFGIGGLVIGAAIVWGVVAIAVNGKHTGLLNMMGMNIRSSGSQSNMKDSDMSMERMVDSLKYKTGDDFDKAFITGMIVHHQGAINIASLARDNAKHNEIKNMAGDIVTAQTKEINQMNIWLTEWGYRPPSSNSHGMMDMGR